MTSNIGSSAIQEITREGGKQSEIKEAVQEILREKFLPEFLNRIDETIVFHPLDRSQIGKIVDLQLQHLENLLAEQEITLEVTPAARQEIANEGYDPVYGARPLKRVIQQRLQNPLATELLRGRVSSGGGLRIDYADGEFTFQPSSPPRADGKSNRKDGKGGTKVETVGVK
jgi:ATP-dependent Clp protease ATP-binding subunit ClpB